MVGPKGRGTNMKALADACRSGQIDAEVGVVISPVDGTPAVNAAAERNIAIKLVPPGEEYGERLLKALEGVDLVCLAGFLRILPNEVLTTFPGGVLNIHPALLPKFGGKGMFGHHVHEAVIAAGEKESGCTVHKVTEVYDEGPILLQLKCPVYPDDTPDTLGSRVLELETKAYPQAVQSLIDARRA